MSLDISKKHKERLRLACLIKDTGLDMMPCSFCEKQNRKCIVAPKEDSLRCSKCVCHGGKCDVNGPLSLDWESIDRQQEKLMQEEEEAMAKILRLRKQQSFLRKRKKEMLRRGLRTLNKLDAAEGKE